MSIPSEAIVSLLKKYPRGMPARAVAEHLGAETKAINGRLSKLAAYGVIKSKKQGPRSIYSVKDQQGHVP